MIRRVHVANLKLGSIALDPRGAHHVRDVLRLEPGDMVELFDRYGSVAIAKLMHVCPDNVVAQVEAVSAPVQSHVELTVAAAIPKADRADWMIEKLSELGVARFIPLVAERSVVVPAGKNKIERWERIAIEAARQSRRIGVMQIAPITELSSVLQSNVPSCYLSTREDALPADTAIFQASLLLIGPEGGWSDQEIHRMEVAGSVATKLTSTVLRVETAAMVAAGIFLSLGRGLTATRSPSSIDSTLP